MASTTQTSAHQQDADPAATAQSFVKDWNAWYEKASKPYFDALQNGQPGTVLEEGGEMSELPDLDPKQMYDWAANSLEECKLMTPALKASAQQYASKRYTDDLGCNLGCAVLRSDVGIGLASFDLPSDLVAQMRVEHQETEGELWAIIPTLPNGRNYNYSPNATVTLKLISQDYGQTWLLDQADYSLE